MRDGRQNPMPGPPWPIERRALPDELRRARARDPIGHRVHLALAALYLFLLPLETAPKDIAFACLTVYAGLRVHATWRTYASVIGDRLFVLLLAWTLWRILSLLWSADPIAGLDAIKAARVVLTPLILWPVIDRVAVLIGAFLLGVLVQNGIQLLQALRWLGLYPDVNGRLNGLLHPIHVGTICVTAVFWHLSAAVTSRGWINRLAWPGLLAAGAGLVFSGSRGPWVATIMSMALLFVVEVIRRSDARRRLVAVAAVGLVATLALWPLAADLLLERWDDAWSGVAVLRDGRIDTNVGYRLTLWTEAWAMFADAPVVGVGAGGFEAAINASGGNAVLLDSEHAHSMYMHELATSGIVGIVLLGAVIVFALVRSFRRRDDTPWSMGTPYVLLAWLLAAMFDAYHLNGHLFGLFAFLVTITMPACAGVRPVRSVLTPPAEPRPGGVDGR